MAKSQITHNTSNFQILRRNFDTKIFYHPNDFSVVNIDHFYWNVRSLSVPVLTQYELQYVTGYLLVT